jgi:hypothetical protein
MSKRLQVVAEPFAKTTQASAMLVGWIRSMTNVLLNADAERLTVWPKPQEFAQPPGQVVRRSQDAQSQD